LSKIDHSKPDSAGHFKKILTIHFEISKPCGNIATNRKTGFYRNRVRILFDPVNMPEPLKAEACNQGYP